VDKMYIQGVIERIESERLVHRTKFADNPAHRDCLPRFEKTIEMLKAELAKCLAEDKRSDEPSDING